MHTRYDVPPCPLTAPKGKRVKGKQITLVDLYIFQTHFKSHKEQTYHTMVSSFEIIV